MDNIPHKNLNLHQMDAYLDLVKTCVSKGGFVHPNLEYRSMGMFSTGPIKAGTVILKIPVTFIIALHTLSFDKSDCFGDWINLALAMHTDSKREDSMFKPWYSMLKHQDHISMLDNAQFELIKSVHTGVWEQIMNRKTKVDNLRKVLDGEELQSALHYLTVVFTRAWTNAEYGCYCVPLLDLYNHVNNGMAIVSTESHRLIQTDRDYESGEELFVKYGDNLNPTLVAINWGFFDENQVHHVTCEPLQLIAKTPEQFKSMKEIADKFQLQMRLKNGNLQVNFPKNCLLTRRGPNLHLVNFLKTYLKIDNVDNGDKVKILTYLKNIVVFFRSSCKKVPIETTGIPVLDIILRSIHEERQIIEGTAEWIKKSFNEIQLGL